MKNLVLLLFAMIVLTGCQTVPTGSALFIDDLRIEQITPNSVVIAARLTGPDGAQGVPGLIRIVHWEKIGTQHEKPMKCKATGWIEVSKSCGFAAKVRIKALESETTYGVLVQGSTPSSRQILCKAESSFVTSK
jgi:hypothetical protein